MTARLAGALLVLAVAGPVTAVAQDYDPNSTGTFSIIARDPATGSSAWRCSRRRSPPATGR